MSFIECASECAKNLEFIQNIDRLKGTDFATFGRRDGLAAAIDEATGRDRDRAIQFASIVWDLVWSRLPIASTPTPEPPR